MGTISLLPYHINNNPLSLKHEHTTSVKQIFLIYWWHFTSLTYISQKHLNLKRAIAPGSSGVCCFSILITMATSVLPSFAAFPPFFVIYSSNLNVNRDIGLTIIANQK